MPTFDDKSPMPFGKYRGEKLANVPASYLLWLYGEVRPIAPNKMTLGQRDLVRYIEDNMEVLKKEIKDGTAKK